MGSFVKSVKKKVKKVVKKVKKVVKKSPIAKVVKKVAKGIKKLGGKVIPTVMEVIPLTKKGKKTIVRYLDAEFDIEIKDSVFTRINLQKRR